MRPTRRLLQRGLAESRHGVRAGRVEQSQYVAADGAGRAQGGVVALLRGIVMPAGYPRSVRRDYWPFYRWEAVKATASSAGYVLTTHCLLQAVGVHSQAAEVALAAATQWVLKDGLGSLGTMAAAQRLGDRVDSDASRLRLRSEILHVAGAGMEMLTLFFPRSFLLLASAANASKGVAGLLLGATRSSIHQHLALRNNLGDLTAKAHSLGIACYMAGLGLGIAVTQSASTSPWLLAASYGLLGATQIAAAVRALRNLRYTSLNSWRFFHLLACHREGRPLPSPETMPAEPLLWSSGPRVEVGVSISECMAWGGHEVALASGHPAIAKQLPMGGDVSWPNMVVLLHQNASDRDALEAATQEYLHSTPEVARAVLSQVAAIGWSIDQHLFVDHGYRYYEEERHEHGAS